MEVFFRLQRDHQRDQHASHVSSQSEAKIDAARKISNSNFKFQCDNELVGLIVGNFQSLLTLSIGLLWLSVRYTTLATMDDLLHSLPEPFAASDLTLVEDIIQETISPSSSSNRNVTNGDGDQIKRDNSYFNSYQDTIILRDKILLLGDKATGKTSLVQTLLEFTNGGDGGGITRDYYQNQDSYQMTKGLEMNVATLSLDDSQEENMNSGSGIPKNFQVDLFLYEMGGQSIFHSHTTATDSNRISTGATATATATKMEQAISKHCSCVMFVFDVSCRKSLQNVIQWMDMMMKLNGERSDDIPMILVGTKVDLRQVSSDHVICYQYTLRFPVHTNHCLIQYQYYNIYIMQQYNRMTTHWMIALEQRKGYNLQKNTA